MIINCDVIRDLLPLYSEKLTSEASNQIVLEHLSKCERCQNELLQMTKDMELPANLNDYNNLKKAKNRDRRFKTIGIVSIVLAMVLIILIIKPYLPYLYTGDRITLCVDGNIDGENVDVNPKAVICKYKNSLQEIHSSKSEPGKFSTKGNEYGKYTFTFPAKDNNIKIELVHTNWWQIENCKLHFNIDSQNNMTYIFTDTSGNIESGTSYSNEKTYTIYFML